VSRLEKGGGGRFFTSGLFLFLFPTFFTFGLSFSGVAACSCALKRGLQSKRACASLVLNVSSPIGFGYQV